ncbi:MAG: S9 family peptidase [Methylibium sp.]|nr:S9 family peptidase [Methylibium sp.]
MNTLRLLARVVRSCTPLLLAFTLSPAPATAAPIPVRDFFRTPAATSPRLSPSGQKIAMLIPGERGRFTLAVADIATPTRFVGIARFGDADVRNFGWINDQRLWFDAVDFQAAMADQMDSGLFAVNADGSDFLKLIQRRSDERRMGTGAAERGVLPQRNRFLRAASDGSDDVIIQRYEYVDEELPPDSKLLRLNTKTRETRSITPKDAPSGVQSWILDRNLEPRVAITGDRGIRSTVLWRNPETQEWVKLTSFDAFSSDANSFTPLAVDAEGQLFVSAPDPATVNGARTSALFRMSPKTGKLPDKPLLSLKGYDFEGAVLFDNETRRTLGVTYQSDADGAVWFDAAMRAVQEDVDKQLAGTVNMLSCSRCSSSKHLIVTSYSDRQSAVYFLYERATRKLSLLAASRPWLDAAKMAEQDFVRVKARDGMEFPVNVTKPQGKGPWPTVVLVHGGPYVRGESWGFSPDSQFLASRGYLVIQPEFRGSTGYGDQLFKAGWKQWGLSMQDDVTDATKWAIAQGLADPKRIAIAGASYGGYATMMGLVKEPELYRAGINWVGVTDIGLMYEVGWSDFMGGKWMRLGMPKMIGDPKHDAEQLKKTSPLHQAARIKQPVFMAYGEEDYRVPMPHGTKMRDALKATGNTQVEWVVYDGEGHGWVLEENNVDFWTRVERFLAKHLK